MDSMFSKALRDFLSGPLRQLLENLGSEEGDQWETQLKRFLNKEPCWMPAKARANPKPPANSNPKPKLAALMLVSTITVPALTGRFVAKTRFVVGTSPKARVQIGYLGDEFTEWFLLKGKPETSAGKATLRFHKLRKSAPNSAIIAKLGGEASAEISLASLYGLLIVQPHGESGVLLNDGLANLFYIRDHSGILRVVLVTWGEEGWDIGALPVEEKGEWLAGFQVLSGTSTQKKN
jgi:hypothetical protein